MEYTHLVLKAAHEQPGPEMQLSITEMQMMLSGRPDTSPFVAYMMDPRGGGRGVSRFRLYDDDNSGSIGYEELQHACKGYVAYEVRPRTRARRTSSIARVRARVRDGEG